MTKITDLIVNSWHNRAVAYDAFISRWPLFTDMADQLVDSLPDDYSGHTLDLAGGSGLLSERLLIRHPLARITLMEPAKNMIELAVHRLGNNVTFVHATAEQLGSHPLSADAVLCNAAFHLMDEEIVFPAIAKVLNPGGICSFNLWGHSFDETAKFEYMVDWLSFVKKAMQEQGEHLPTHSPHIAPRARSIQGLQSIAERCGLALYKYMITEHRTHARFGIEFAAMSENFLKQLEPQKRLDVINRAIELSSGHDVRMSAVFVFLKK